MTKYTDTVDVDIRTSLHEYGIIRNPKTDRTILTMYDYEGKYKAHSTFISLDDVKTALEDQGQGFYDYIGTSKETELEQLDNENLAHIIGSLNSYNGWLLPHY